MGSHCYLLLLALTGLTCVLSDWVAPKFCNGLECPKYTVVETTTDYEVRTYKSSKWVITSMSGVDHDIARNAMFNRLFLYISGENKPGKKVDMTTPVLTKVMVQGENNYTMGFFVAPSEAVDAPEPSNPEVSLSNLPEQTVYIRAFPGFARMEDYIKARDKLKDALPKDVQYETSYHYNAGYDSPFKPFNRHNEAWLVARI